MTIYKITNKINGKSYIGQTTTSLITRWYKHTHKSSGCLAIHNAIEKYGKENFTIETIDTASTKEELNEKEKYWIEFFNTISPNGYNLKTGGNDCKYTEESLKRMGEGVKKHWENTPFPTSKPVFQFTLDGSFVQEWSSGAMAARRLGISQPEIFRCCEKQTHHKSAGGFMWSYSRDEPIKYERLGNGLKRQVICIETGEIFNSISEAGNSKNILRQDVSKCCRGVQKSAGGYHWRYADQQEVG